MALKLNTKKSLSLLMRNKNALICSSAAWTPYLGNFYWAMIIQKLRKLWSESDAQAHIENLIPPSVHCFNFKSLYAFIVTNFNTFLYTALFCPLNLKWKIIRIKRNRWKLNFNFAHPSSSVKLWNTLKIFLSTNAICYNKVKRLGAFTFGFV